MHEKKQPPEFIIGRSWSLAHQNKHKEALEDLLSISEKDRGSRWSIAYSNFLFNLGETEKAIKHLEFVLKFKENLDIKENERNTPLTTKNLKLYAALAQNYLIVSREKEALYIFRKRADLLYRLDDPQQNLPNQTYILSTAELALKIGKNNLAITYFKKLRANPGNSHAKLFKIPPLKPIEERRNDAFPVARLFGLALAHERIGEITQSFFYYAELLQRYPYHQKGLKNFYKMIKHYGVVEGVSVRKEGLELLYELAQKYPQQSFLQTIMAKLAQDIDLKKAHLEKLKVKFPYQNEIEYTLAKVCRNRRDYQDALDYALSYQQKNPDLHQEKIRSITTSTLQIAIDPQLQDCLQRFPQTKSYVVGPSAHACLEQNPLNKVNIVVNATHQSFLLHGLSPCPYKENLYNTYVNGLHVNYYFSPVSEESTQKFLLEDALTRDFTFNCLYIDAQGVVHDPLLGLALKHYRQSILSTPIPADKSFQEDPARLLHALAAIIYGYTPTDEVWEALHSWQACGILNRGNFKAILRKDLHSFNEEQTEKYLDLLRSTNLAQKLFNIPSSLVSYETVNYVAQNYKRKLDFFESKPLRSCIKVEPHPNCYYDEKYSQLILERIKNSPFI